MRTLLTIMALALLITTGARAQTKTTEAKTTETQKQIDSTTGKVIESSVVTSIATTEDITVRQNMIYIDPVKFFGMFNIGYQRAITPLFTVGGVVQSPTQLSDATGFGVIAEGRYYPGAKAFRGFHVGATLSYNSISFEHYNYESEAVEEATIDPVSLGAVIGWHWYPWDDFAVELALGADYTFNGVKKNGSAEYFADDAPFVNNVQGILPSFRVHFGYAW